MKRKNYTLFLTAALALSVTANAFVVEWEKIRHWAGTGDNKAALVVQFDDGGAGKAYVWGYRWADGEEASGEDMFRAIASSSNDLYLFTQYTGWMGNTVCGIGVSPDNSVATNIVYDFDGAMEDPNISFNWFSANTFLGQTSIPGWDTPDLCAEAIEEAEKTNILEHPVNALTYGYACYDYDHWLMYKPLESVRWHAGWYKGYWSYWVGGVDSESLSYSGLGYTSRKLSDGSVDAWKYTHLTSEGGRDDVDGYSGASTPWHELDYSHFEADKAQLTTVGETLCTPVYYTLDGMRLSDNRRPDPGIYIVDDGEVKRKIIIR